MNGKENLRFYEKLRSVPKEAQRDFNNGSYSGTNIDGMWRIQILTATFGPCGFGWYYTIDKQWLEESPDGSIAAFTNITMYIKDGDEWSAGIPGTGGNIFVRGKSKRMSDEAFKMALTDAISVSAKAIGVGADIYWGNDPSKYDTPNEDAKRESAPKTEKQVPSQKVGKAERMKKLSKLMADKNIDDATLEAEITRLKKAGLISMKRTAEMTSEELEQFIDTLYEYIG